MKEISYEDFGTDLQSLYNIVKDAKIDCILYLGTSGMIPAAFLAQKLEVPIISYGQSRYVPLSAKKVLFVDAMITPGEIEWRKQNAEYLQCLKRKEILFACLYPLEGCEPDFYCYRYENFVIKL